MAKRTGGGEVDAADLRRLLIATVVEYGTHKLGPHVLNIPRRALAAADVAGALATLELGGGLLLTYTSPRPAPKPKR
jgi:hypothetical protein